MSLIVTLFAAGAAASPAPAVAHPGGFTPTASHCPKTTQYYALDKNMKVRPQRLDRLPPANAYRTVYRLVDGCEVPVVVRYNVSGGR